MTASVEEPPEDDKIGALTTEAERLNTNVGALYLALRRNRILAVATAVGLILDVVLTVVLATVLNGQADENRRIKDSLRQNYVTAQQQADTRAKVLCPLYDILLASAADQAQHGALTPAQQKQLSASVAVIRSGYATLGCLNKTPSPPSAS